MDPGTRYAKTKDGASIAYAVIGEGHTLVNAGNIWGDLHAQQHNPAMALTTKGLASEGFRVVLYDTRGMGGSDRSTRRYDFESRLLDLEAVVEAVGVDTFPIHAVAGGAPQAIAYAAAHPDRVTHLILVNGYARGQDWYDLLPAMKLSRQLSDTADDDWETYTLAMANAVMQYTDSDLASKMAAAYRDSATPAEYLGYSQGTAGIDVSDQLSLVKCPTLVISLSGVMKGALPISRDIASAIPDARLIEVPPGPQWGDAVRRFILGDSAPSSLQHESTFRTVLFTDLVGHTEMMSRLGDEAGRVLLREHEAITREVLKANGGTEVKTMGDGFMASFTSVTRALECAIALQRAFADRNPTPSVGQGPSPDSQRREPLHVRVGLNAGEPIEEDGDLFGATVILASRIAARANAGEILVSDNVRSLSSGKGFLFADRGEFVAKGFEEPVRIYEVKWRE